ELIALERRDVDLRQGLLMIRGTKFGKSRIVPLHDSTRHALADYAHRRDRHPDRQSAVKFLVSDHGGPLEASTVRRTFYHLSHKRGCAEQVIVMAHACMIFVTDSRLQPC